MHHRERSPARGLLVALALMSAAAMAGQVYGIAKGLAALF